jgi:hypothetical protein
MRSLTTRYTTYDTDAARRTVRGVALTRTFLQEIFQILR